MFATTRGTVRRNKLSDFVQVNRNGKIAMKLDEGDGIVDVQICTEHDDVLLTTARRPVHPLPGPEVRVFKGRDSTGVRGIASPMATTPSSRWRSCIIRCDSGRARRVPQDAPPLCRRGEGEERAVTSGGCRGDRQRHRARPGALCRDVAAEQFILTVSENGYGKRTSSFEYRVTGRGGKGIVAMASTTATASSSPRSRWRTRTRSCSSPMAAR
jgi:DNA gyrase subunit A